MRMILIVLAALSVHQVSFAATPEEAAMQAAIDARDEFVHEIANKNFDTITHQGFDYAIRELAKQIKANYADEVMATSLLDQWNRSSSNFSDLVTQRLLNKDLGDHDPLFPWINTFLAQMSEKYGSIIMTLPIVKDIQMLNYAIPVVFQPHGTWQSSSVDNRIEYRKHFIPFANLVTYYVTRYGCEYALAHYGMSDMKKVCPKAADKLEHVMGRYIAPVASDWIFKAGNRPLNVNDRQLRYRTVDQLRNAIQN